MDSLQKQLTSLMDFVNKTRNVHLEVKEGVKKAHKAFVALRDKINGEGAPEKARKGNSDKDSILEAIEEVNKRMARTEENVRKLAENQSQRPHSSAPPVDIENEGTWAKVARKPAKTKQSKSSAEANEHAGPRPRSRPPAILVNVGNDSYAGALKLIKESGKVRELAQDINSLSKTKKGDVLVKLRHGSSAAGSITEAIRTAMGDKGSAKELINYDKLLVKDLDELAEKDEVIAAVSTLTGSDLAKFRVTANFTVDRGMRWMVVAMEPGNIDKVLKAGKIRVGYTVCGVRRWEERRTGRCPRCLVGGHMAKDCAGPDRRHDCRGCGVTGHHVATCKASDEEASRFRRILENERLDTEALDKRSGEAKQNLTRDEA